MQGFAPAAALEACPLQVLLWFSRSFLLHFEETHVLEAQFMPCFLKDLRKGKQLCSKYPLAFAFCFLRQGAVNPVQFLVEHFTSSFHLGSYSLVISAMIN